MRVHLRKVEVAGDRSVKKSETATYYKVFLLVEEEGVHLVGSYLGPGKDSVRTLQIYGGCERPFTSAVAKQRS